MKRKALLFGNSTGLPGVKRDIFNYSRFLMSDLGGQWYNYEIDVLMNPTKSELMAKIQSIKSEKPDFMWVVYSGHGAYSRGTTLEINSKGEFVHEADLRSIASRQLLIFDCCRSTLNINLSEIKAYRRSLQLLEAKRNLRPAYDSRVMQAIEQQSSLYACSIGESSYDTNDGGIYSNSLLSSIIPSTNEQFKLASIAQEEAKTKTIVKAREVYSKSQTPDHSLPRCISSQQLIISINPNL